MDTREHISEPLYRDTAAVQEVIVFKRKEKLFKRADITLYGDRIVVTANGTEQCFSFDEVTAVTVLGRNKANIYHAGRVFQLKGDKHFNALKYVHIYYRNKNIQRGDFDGEFLGL